jgi:hypothetical protein
MQRKRVAAAVVKALAISHDCNLQGAQTVTHVHGHTRRALILQNADRLAITANDRLKGVVVINGKNRGHASAILFRVARHPPQRFNICAGSAENMRPVSPKSRRYPHVPSFLFV